MDTKHVFKVDETDELSIDESKTFNKRYRRRYIYIGIVIAACVLALVLGLGIGLTRNKGNNTPGNVQSQHGNQSTSTATAAVISNTTVTPSHTTSTLSGKTNIKPSSMSTHSVTAAQSTTTSKPWINEQCNNQTEKCPWKQDKGHPVLLVSLDGFRADYIRRNMTPVIQRLRDCGVHTPYMRAAYPTLTFPNHYTIVTGLYPESHGIVENNMYDPVLNQSFSIGSDTSMNPAWWQGEPLWTTAKKQGKKTASYFWVGSEVNISGSQPDIFLPYNPKVPYEDRVDQVLEWLTWPEESRPDFITLYFNNPDHVGHGFGPESQQVNEELARVDKIIGRLMDGLYARHISNCVNVIILADHGMESTSCDRTVSLSSYFDTYNYNVFDGTIGRIQKDFKKEKINKESVIVRKENETSVEELMKDVRCKSVHYTAFTKSDIPVRHHYVHNRRIGEVVMDVQARWLVQRSQSNFCLRGNHGYDNIYKSMHALFLAYGPGFQQNFTAKPFENIEVYNMIAGLLKITPAPNNGTIGSLDYILKQPNSSNEQPDKSPMCSVLSNNEFTGGNFCTCSKNPTLPANMISNSNASLPFGSPANTSRTDICQLTNTHFSSGFSQMYRLPSWTAFTLSQPKKSSLTNDDCISLDNRVQDNSYNCSSYHNTNVTHAFMFDPEFSNDSTSRVSSNIVPMFKGFKSGIWSYLWRMVNDHVAHSNGVHVTVGPVFDHDHDGLWNPIVNITSYVTTDHQVVLPTHFYVILMRCASNKPPISCPSDDLEILSFILPHLNQIPNCLSFQEYLSHHVARIRDVELITGLQFLSALQNSVSLRIFLPETMWSTQKFALRWKDLPCSEKAKQKTCPGKIPLLLISLDGFKAQYLDRHLTPTIEKLRGCGVHTPYMRSVYPTITFPNHYSIATGLYPESHGIISNKMYDGKIGQYFTLGSRTSYDPRWWAGEPIWITAKKHNKISATYFWPGSDVNISGIYPDYYKRYDQSKGYPERVYTVLDWLTMKKESLKPDFITLYFDSPDHYGHIGGPESNLVNDALVTMDEVIGRLMDGLYQKGLHNCVNIIMIADHGFDDISCNKVVKLKGYLHNDLYSMLPSYGPFGRIQTKYHGPRKNITVVNNPLSVANITDRLMCQTSTMKVFTKDTIPKRFHYSHNPRIGEILLDMRNEWLVTSSYYPCKGGNHGWDNLSKAMHALFLAHGPGFKSNFTIDPFENIELYNLMSDILGITPAPNNGTVGSLDHILIKPSKHTMHVNSDIPYCPNSSELTAMCNCSSLGNNLIIRNKTYEADTPFQAKNSSGTCLLSYPNLLIAFDWHNNHPKFAASTLTNKLIITNKASQSTSSCVLKDSRVGNPSCSEFQTQNMTMGFLQPTETLDFVSGRVQGIVQEAVPMYEGFKSGIWDFTMTLIKNYANVYDNVTLVTGPAYDHDGDGLPDVSLQYVKNSSVPNPSHYFAVMMKCKTSGQSFPCNGDDSIDIQSFVLPHVDVIPNCQYKGAYLRDNVARVRDVELLTGLVLSPRNFSLNSLARLKTYLPVDIWPAKTLNTWIDLPCGPAGGSCKSSYQPLILISLGGFRPDYIFRNSTPYLRKLWECGVRTPKMRPVYPTKSFPNLYTVVTGLYPESHGIIDDKMYDPNIRKLFSPGKSTTSDSSWWGGEPIWITAQKQNKKTASYFWPGSDVRIQGQYPTKWEKYDSKIFYDVRVKQILDWMTSEHSERPQFITLYINEPGSSGKSFGPDDIAHISMGLRNVDNALGDLMEGLYRKNLHNCANIIILSDHGVSSTSCDRAVSFTDYLTSVDSKMEIYDGACPRIDSFHYYSRGSLKNVTNPYHVPDIIANLTCHQHFNVFNKKDLPKRFHYANNKRIDDIVVTVEDKWLTTYMTLTSYTRGKYACKELGSSGYDNSYENMQALFLAHGPSFKSNFTIETFENIELYNLMADILEIAPVPNNGTRGSLNHILSKHTSVHRQQASYDYGTVNITQQRSDYNVVCAASCHIPTNAVIQNMVTSYENKHIPFGRPSFNFTDSKISIDRHPTYVSAFSSDVLPVWVSYTINQTQVDSISNIGYPSCMLTSSGPPSCFSTSFNDSYVWTPLFRTGMNTTWESLLQWNFVPMMQSFRSNVWSWMNNKIKDYADRYNEINVVTGPIFDYDADGKRDEMRLHQATAYSYVPSHFFFILSKCENPTQDLGACRSLDTLSIIVPHKDDINCRSTEDFVKDNMARVRDIELLTGFELFTSQHITDAIQLRTALSTNWW